MSSGSVTNVRLRAVTNSSSSSLFVTVGVGELLLSMDMTSELVVLEVMGQVDDWHSELIKRRLDLALIMESNSPTGSYIHNNSSSSRVLCSLQFNLYSPTYYRHQSTTKERFVHLRYLTS